jgi:alpha-galactosidase
VTENTPIFGSDACTADIAVTSSTCTWNADTFGEDATKHGGQAYYDSLMALHASWGTSSKWTTSAFHQVVSEGAIRDG